MHTFVKQEQTVMIKTEQLDEAANNLFWNCYFEEWQLLFAECKSEIYDIVGFTQWLE